MRKVTNNYKATTNKSVYLLRNTPDLLYRGRLFLAIAELFVVLILLVHRWERTPFGYAALFSLCLYNFVIVGVLGRQSLENLRVWLILLGDYIFVTLACVATGNAESPLLGHFYLLTLVSALFYGAMGGILVGFLTGMTTVFLGFREHNPYPFADVLHTAPYFPLIGAFSGFLVGEIQRWVGRYTEQVGKVELHQENEMQYQQELNLARRVQESAAPSTLPNYPGFTFAVRSHPSQEVGGDFHLFLSESDDNNKGTLYQGAILGDVAGKGIAAALIATSLTTVLPYLHPLRDPFAAFSHLNQDLYERSPEASFVTLLCARFSAHQENIHLFNAGHYPPLLWQDQESKLYPTPLTDRPPLGLMPCTKTHSDYSDYSECQEQVLPFTHGDTILLYSDALVETQDVNGEMFGEKRLAEVFAHHAAQEHIDAETLADALVAALLAHGPLTDDLTLLLCQRKEQKSKSR